MTVMEGWLRIYLVGLADGVSAGFQSQCIRLDCFGMKSDGQQAEVVSGWTG